MKGVDDMAKTLPGTTIPVDWSRPEEAETRLNSLFLAGGLMLSQVASLTGLEPYVIQNWVRRGFVAPPERKGCAGALRPRRSASGIPAASSAALSSSTC